MVPFLVSKLEWLVCRANEAALSSSGFGADKIKNMNDRGFVITVVMLLGASAECFMHIIMVLMDSRTWMVLAANVCYVMVAAPAVMRWNVFFEYICVRAHRGCSWTDVQDYVWVCRRCWCYLELLLLLWLVLMYVATSYGWLTIVFFWNGGLIKLVYCRSRCRVWRFLGLLPCWSCMRRQ